MPSRAKTFSHFAKRKTTILIICSSRHSEYLLLPASHLCKVETKQPILKKSHWTQNCCHNCKLYPKKKKYKCIYRLSMTVHTLAYDK